MTARMVKILFKNQTITDYLMVAANIYSSLFLPQSSLYEATVKQVTLLLRSGSYQDPKLTISYAYLQEISSLYS